jgi:hypothetical protein
MVRNNITSTTLYLPDGKSAYDYQKAPTPFVVSSLGHRQQVSPYAYATPAAAENVRFCRVQLVGAMVNTWPPGIMK